MLNAKSFLALDFGATTLKMAAFEPNEAGGLRLVHYAFRPLGQEGMQEGAREAAIQRALQGILSESGYGSRQANVCAPGFQVFSKFVKLPPVDTSKVTQIIQYEAQQNVPFPLEEVVWDYQILGATATGELEVLLVAIKSEIVEGLFRTTEASGLKLGLVDVSPAALANAFRYNYGDLEGCTMLLDIGAKTSNLLFFDKDNVYARGINIGANSITVDFGKESKLSYDAAEELKISQGFVSLGGAYEEPDDPAQQAISKISRQVMTRLHIQVNQTIQFYRGQQGGTAPVRLFLSGGASAMPYTAQFFAEKLNVPVEYFNPLRNVQIDPSINIEELAKVGHQMGEVVGLGLRNLAHCPVELNLMPKSSLKKQEFTEKKPFLIATMACIVAIVFAYGFFYNKIVDSKAQALEHLQQQIAPLHTQRAALQNSLKQLNGVQAQATQYADWLAARTYWATALTQARTALIAAEARGKQEFEGQTGVWIERFLPDCSGLPGAPNAPATGGAAPSGRQGRGRPAPPSRPAPTNPGLPPGFPGGPGGAAAQQPAFVLGTNEVGCTTVTIICRAVDIGKPGANDRFAYMVDEALRQQPMFVPTNMLRGELRSDGSTFTFELHVALKQPLIL